jgi:hypothetical protein
MAEINIFKCDVCGREFELNYQLEMHERTARNAYNQVHP